MTAQSSDLLTRQNVNMTQLQSSPTCNTLDLVLELTPDILGQTCAVVDEGLTTLPGSWKTFLGHRRTYNLHGPFL